MKKVMCFNCAKIYEWKSSMKLVCPVCAYTISAIRYDKIYNYAKDAAEFGHNYRTLYEEQLKEEGDISRHYYAIELGNAFYLYSIAVISMLALKYSATKMMNSLKKVEEEIKCNEVKHNVELQKLIENKDKHEIFIKHLEFYHTNFLEIDPRIKEAIIEEMIVHKAMDMLDCDELSEDIAVTMPKKRENEGRSIMHDNMQKAKEEVMNYKRIRVDYFNEMWKDL